MAKTHQILFLAVVLSCDIFLDSEAASALDVNLRVDVNGKTVIDESYTEGKFVIYVLVILYRGILTFDKLQAFLLYWYHLFSYQL